jgi:hypothetical protein
MNNALTRLIDGMVATLRAEVIPATQGEYARGQAFGVIYMLESLKLRTDWSPAFLRERADALAALADAIEPEDAAAARDIRERGDAAVCDLIDRRTAPHPAIDAYIHRQLRHEIATSARPMFAEMSLGKEET